MNATLPPSSFNPTALAAPTKPLWSAVGVLSICVLAMGATLVHVNKRPELFARAAIPLSSAQAMNAPAALTASAEMFTPEKNVEKPSRADIKSAQNAPKSVAKPMASAAEKIPASAPSTAPVVVAQAPIKPACASCGTVEAVTPVTKEGQGSGVGVIAGGLLGGVVGNQMGKGSGRAVATVLGAIGGGVAGNTIEKKMKKDTSYSVRVRMEDGSSRTLEQSTAPMVGSKVTLDGNTMRPV